MAQEKTGIGKVEEFMGKPVSPAIEYSFSWKAYENVGEAKNSEDWPNDADMLKFVNQRAERSAKAQSYQTAIKDLKSAYENSNEFKIAQLVKAAVAAGFSQAEAEALAQSKLG
jgi:hypothetical protein